jgi:hypothetical protein
MSTTPPPAADTIRDGVDTGAMFATLERNDS